MSNKLDDVIDNSVSVDLKKREFMGKVGKYAVGAGMATLMTPTLSTAKSYANNGFGIGSGDRDAPGGSELNNGAENLGGNN